MKCFNHSDHDAIGICKSCQKGLCLECHTLVDGSMACKATCEEDVKAANYIVAKSAKVYKGMGKQWRPTIILNLLSGTLLLGIGLSNIDGKASWFFIALGLFFIFGGILSIFQGNIMGGKQNSSKTQQ